MKIFVDKCQMSPIQMERLCFNCRVFINALGAFNKEGTPSSPNIKYCEFDCSFMSKLENPNFRPPLGARRQVLTHCVRNQSSGGQRRGWGEERIYPAHHPPIGQQMMHTSPSSFSCILFVTLQLQFIIFSPILRTYFVKLIFLWDPESSNSYFAT